MGSYGRGAVVGRLGASSLATCLRRFNVVIALPIILLPQIPTWALANLFETTQVLVPVCASPASLLFIRSMRAPGAGHHRAARGNLNASIYLIPSLLA
eukprot:COSAG02_NODE_4344_length_5475_cov_2.278832_4_plen_98_part_00